MRRTVEGQVKVGRLRLRLRKQGRCSPRRRFPASARAAEPRDELPPSHLWSLALIGGAYRGAGSKGTGSRRPGRPGRCLHRRASHPHVRRLPRAYRPCWCTFCPSALGVAKGLRPPLRGL